MNQIKMVLSRDSLNENMLHFITFGLFHVPAKLANL